MTEGFRRLMMYKKVDKNVLGYLRATEVTYSTEHEIITLICMYCYL